jgi:hypothetical protein
MIVLSTRVNDDAVVLIVENNPQYVASLKGICKEAGFSETNIHVEREVKEARAAVDRFNADLVLLDLATADSPNNPSIGAKELAKWQGDFAVIVVSNYPEAVEGSRQPYAVIRKPPEPNKLRSAKKSSNPDLEKHLTTGEFRGLNEQHRKLLREAIEHFTKLQMDEFRENIEDFRDNEMKRFRGQVSLAILSALDLKCASKTFRGTFIQSLAGKYTFKLPFGLGEFSKDVKGMPFIILALVSILVVLAYTVWHKFLPSWMLNK